MNQITQQLITNIWSLSDFLKGSLRQSQYWKIILAFTLLRRLECLLEVTKKSVIAEHEKLLKMDLPEDAKEKLLLQATDGLTFFNISEMELSKLGEADIKNKLESYIHGFSKEVQGIFENFRFFEIINQIDDDGILLNIIDKVRNIDLSKKTISNYEIGVVFEELNRHFIESSGETFGEHFTPPDIVRLITKLVFLDVDDSLIEQGVIGSIYDPAAGTGGFLSSSIEYVHELNTDATLRAYGQELNSDAYAICKANMLIKGQDISNIRLGNSLSLDRFYSDKFDYMLSNPPFGLAWKNIESEIKDEYLNKGFDGRFGPGLPRVSDGSFLFLLHLISKLKDKSNGGGRIGIIMYGATLVTGSAGSGESEIRRYILESDLLESIIALPTGMFYNTGIPTYVWILSNKKSDERKDKILVIDSISHLDKYKVEDSPKLFSKMRKSLGSKRNIISDEDITTFTDFYKKFKTDESANSTVFNTMDFGYRRITIERPLRIRFIVNAENLTKYKETKGMEYFDSLSAIQHETIFDNINSFLTAAQIENISAAEQKVIISCFGKNHPDANKLKDLSGNLLPDVNLRKYENVPLGQNIYDYFKAEILPYMPDAWIDETKRDKKDHEIGIVGYEININRIRLNTQIERLETQYKNYTESNLGRLALEINNVNLEEYFDERANAIYIRKVGSPLVLSNLVDVVGKHKNYVQVVLNSHALSEYIVSFFKSSLGDMAIQAAMVGANFPLLRASELDKITVALPDLVEQKNVVNTLSKLSTLKKAIDNFDDELALNPTSSKAILEQLDSMLDTIGGLTEADEIRGVVRNGETELIEFKSTLSLDLKTKKKEVYIETSAFKTIVAFLNSDGGTLLIGIADDGEILGVHQEVDKFYKGNSDKYLLHWKNRLKTRIGEQFYPFIKAKLVYLDEKYILKIDCLQALSPCYLDNSDFYVRTNPATDKLEGPKLVEYVNNHFKL